MLEDNEESIAILINGAMRNHVDKNFIFDVIKNVREEFNFIKKCHIYFATWKEKPNDMWRHDYIELDDEYLEKIKCNVDFFYLFDTPNDFDEKFSITNEIP
jgi:hypothetical protein